MKSYANVWLTACILLASATSFAETINVGRSDVSLTIPAGYSESEPAPLVVLLHGYTSSGERQESYMRFAALADEYGFLYLTPDGTKETSARKNRFWNATSACCDIYGSGVDDSTYLRNLIDAVKDEYAVDEKRVFLIGHSNGGFMSHRMAFDHPDTIAAIASLAGASLPEMTGEPPQNPVHILQIHGTHDKTVKYGGGKFGERARYPGAADSLEKWVTYNKAESARTLMKDKLDLERTISGKETTVTRFDNAGNIELWTIEAGGHVPQFTESFTRHVIDWLFAHPKS